MLVQICDGVEEIVGEEEDHEGVLETMPLQFVFPNAWHLHFTNMLRLKSFYLGMHASHWPSLKQLEVYKCDEVKIFAMELSIFQGKHEVDPLMSQQSLFIIKKLYTITSTYITFLYKSPLYKISFVNLAT